MADDSVESSPERLSSALISKPDAVVYREFSSETTILNLDTGMYHSLNATGARMFDALVETGDFDASVGRVSAEFAVDEEIIRRDLASLCGSLQERGLLEIAPRG